MNSLFGPFCSSCLVFRSGHVIILVTQFVCRERSASSVKNEKCKNRNEFRYRERLKKFENKLDACMDPAKAPTLVFATTNSACLLSHSSYAPSCRFKRFTVMPVPHAGNQKAARTNFLRARVFVADWENDRV